MSEAVSKPSGSSSRSSGMFGVLEVLCPGINEMISSLVGDAVEGKQTKPSCPHGNFFCDDDWLPTHPKCGCKPTMAQIYVMTHYALSPNSIDWPRLPDHC